MSIQVIQPHTRRTRTTGIIHQGKSQEGIYSTIKITNGIPFLLCQQERWEITTNTGLQVPQLMDNQECLSIDKGHFSSYMKLCDFTLLFMTLQVELRLNKRIISETQTS